MRKTTQRVTALVAVFLFVVASVGAVGVHSHAEGNDQSCTLCQALHLSGALTTVSALSRPALPIPVVAPSETQRTFHALPPSLTYRGPPTSSSIS